MNRFLHTQSPARIIAAGFALAILLGSVLLILPCSVQDGVDLQYIDALYTSTSAVCVTGLIAVDAGDTFTPLGQFFLAMLIQVGGLGVTAVGAGIIVAMGRKVDMKARSLIREAMNLDSGKGVILFVKSIFVTTVIFELTGAALSFLLDHRLTPGALTEADCRALLRFASAAASLTTTRRGGIPAMPTRAEVAALLHEDASVS